MNTVFIPCAGTGSRLGRLTKNRNKSLIDIGGMPIISHILDKFSIETNFVIALGFESDTLRQYINSSSQIKNKICGC